MNNRPPLEDLHLFCTVARNRSFILSAKALGVSPAYVSKRIALLEGVLGVRLLNRTTRHVGLNEEGETVFLWAQRILEDADQMTEAISTTKLTPRGLLRISTSEGFGRKLIGPALSELALSCPSLRIQLELFTRKVDLIAEGFDLDLRFGGESQQHLIVKRIMANARVLCAAPAYVAKRGMPAGIVDLEKHDCIVVRERDQSYGIWKLDGPRGVETARVSGPLSCSNGEIGTQWALDGHGITLRSTWDVGEKLREGSLVRVLPEYQQDAPISAVYPIRLTESAKVRVCVEFLQQWLRRPSVIGRPGEM
jgi:LysR family transcriptional regulator, transcriptional activator for dmlA